MASEHQIPQAGIPVPILDEFCRIGLWRRPTVLGEKSRVIHVMCVYVQPCVTLSTPGTVACQAPLSMELSRKEYWSELPFPTPGNLPRPRDRTPGSCIDTWVLYHECHRGSPNPHRIAYKSHASFMFLKTKKENLRVKGTLG